MLHTSNTLTQHQMGRIATLVLSVVLVIGGPAAWAQPSSLTPRDAMDSYQMVNSWVRTWDIESDPVDEARTVPLSVASVTIRIDGKVVGRSAIGSLAPDDLLLWRAARQAMHRASVHLPTERDAGWEADRAAMISSMTLAVELSAVLIPIADSDLELPGFGRTPASMGIAIRSADSLSVATIDWMLTQGIDPAQSARSLAVELSGDGARALDSMSELIDAGFKAYRFDEIVLAQPAPGFGAEFLDRGGRVVHGSEINTGEIQRFAAGLASHLRAQRWAGIERYGVMGPLNPVSGKHSPRLASPFEQSLAALSLLRYASLGDTLSHQQAESAGLGLLRDLSVVEPGESSIEGDLVAVAACLVAVSEIDAQVVNRTPELVTIREQVLGMIGRGYTDLGGFDRSVDPSAHGLIAWALVRGSIMDSRIDRAVASSAVRSVFREVPASQLVGQMPFLGWAELDLANADRIPAEVALGEMRQLMWDHMLRPADLDPFDRDLSGGIVFTSSSTPLPSWHALRPLAFVATMLGDERLTAGTVVSGQVPSEISEVVQSIRFVRQLAATAPSTHMYARAEAAEWGIRASLWDQNMPIESSAMGLLMMSETLRSLDRLAEREAPGSQGDEKHDSD